VSTSETRGVPRMRPEDYVVPERDVRSEELVVNMGPQHPATHGVLRVAVKIPSSVGCTARRFGAS